MKPSLLNGNVLAFIGDAIYSLQVRSYFVEKEIFNTKKLQKLTTQLVSAKGQNKALHYLYEKNILNDEELEIVKRGRNAKSSSVAKNVDIQTYRNATGFEALWGYLYLNASYDRLQKLFSIIVEEEVYE